MGLNRPVIAVGVALAYAVSVWLAATIWDDVPVVIMVVSSVALVVSLAWLLGQVQGALVALLIAASLNRYTTELGGLTIKPELLVTPLVGVVLLPTVPRMLARLDRAGWLLVAWAGWSVVGGLLNAPDPIDSTRLWLMLALAFFSYAAASTLVVRATHLRSIVTWWLGAGMAVGLFGIVMHLLFRAGLDLGVQVNPVTRDPTIPGSFHESNLFGSAVMMVGLAGLTMLVLGDSRRRLALSAAVIGALAIQVSYTRTVWVAFLGGLIMIGVMAVVLWLRSAGYSNRFEAAWRPIALWGIAIAIGTTILWTPNVRSESDVQEPDRQEDVAELAPASETPPNVLIVGTPVPDLLPTPLPRSGDIGSRVTSVTDVGDSSVRIRLEFSKRALEHWREHPFVGNGIGSFGHRYITTSNDRAWLSNIFVRVLHDGGIVGAALFLAALSMYVWKMLRVMWRPAGTDAARTALTFGIAMFAMLVAFQATEGLQLAWYWFSIGVFAAALRVAEHGWNREIEPVERHSPAGREG